MNDAMLYVRPDVQQLDEVGESEFGLPRNSRVAVLGYFNAESVQESGGGHHRVLAMDGDKWKVRSSYRARQGGNGFGINSDGASYTLNTVDRHIVAILNRT